MRLRFYFLPLFIVALFQCDVGVRAQDAGSDEGAGGDTCSITNCADCVDPDVECYECQSGYVRSEDHDQCLRCPWYCEECEVSAAGVTECVDCQFGFFRTSDKTCSRCPGNCDMCPDGGTGETCSSCSAGFYLADSSVVSGCLGCPSNCLVCPDDQNCAICRDGFYLDASNNCQVCPAGLSLCESCTSGSRCDVCISGRYWDGTTCSSCMSHCTSCSSQSTCTDCQGGYVLSSGGATCIPTTYCDAFSDGSGCTSCIPGYQVSEQYCVACHVLTQSNCAECRTDERGHYWDSGAQECRMCSEFCTSCTSDTSCDACISGKVWDDTSGTGACLDCAVADLTVSSRCQACSGLFWDGACSPCTADPATSNECSSCAGADRGTYWVNGQCLAVDCTAAVLTEPECNACDGRLWDGACQTVVCGSGSSLTEADCATCPELAWTPDSCDAPQCDRGDVNHDVRCTQCGNRYWTAQLQQCIGVDCSQSLLSETQCQACPNKYYDASSTSCTAIDCANDLLDTESKCWACRKEQKHWDGSTCADIDCGVDALDTANKCWVCAAAEFDKYWNTGSGTCEDAVTDAICTGSFDSEAKCLGCFGMYYDDANAVCKAVHCNAEPADAAQCEACPGYYWDPSQNSGFECVAFDCANAVPQLEGECTASRACDYAWVNGACALQVCANAQTTTEGCTVCGNVWTAGSCGAVDCAGPSLLPEYKCDYCFGWYWDPAEGASGQCMEVVNCLDLASLDTITKCNNCQNTYWDGTDCKAMFAVTANIHDSWRCAAVTGTNIWSTDNGQCFDCGDNCVSCDSSGVCQSCQSGFYLDAETSACMDCGTGDLTVQANCNSCPSVVWVANTCRDCIDRCVECSNDISCDVCENGYMYDVTSGMCASCLYDTAAECSACASSSRGKYFLDSVCYDCPIGCTECSGDTACSECVSGYFLSTSEGGTTCELCGVDYSDETRCTTCAPANKVWNAATTTCEDCPSGCLSCSSPGSCDNCGSAKYFDAATPSCESCISGCFSCPSASACDNCGVSKFFNSQTTTCDNCIASCHSCSSATTCDVCDANKFFSSADQACVACATNCADCHQTEGCKACDAGYFLEGGQCVLCMTGCAFCQSATTCDVCNAGKCWDSDNGACQPTSSNCLECSWVEASSEARCTSCPEAFALEVCLACQVPWCKTCIADTCSDCFDRYYLSDDASQCLACTSNCMMCGGPDSCQACDARYFWHAGDMTCNPCGTNCAVCGDETSCTQCVSSAMFNDGAGNCENCMSGCMTCSDAASCTACYPGKYYRDDQCQDCTSNCAMCHFQDPDVVCDMCNLGYFMLDSGDCEVCTAEVADCAMCDDVNNDGVIECITCNAGFTLSDDGTTCLPCTVTSCDECEDPAPYCETCELGFFPTYEMDACDIGCFTCEGDGCDEVQGDNSTAMACPGMGVTHNCWVIRETVGEGTPSYTRGCHNITCTETNTLELCVTTDGLSLCTKCCEGANCNTFSLTGFTDSGATVVKAMFGVSVAMAVAVAMVTSCALW